MLIMSCSKEQPEPIRPDKIEYELLLEQNDNPTIIYYVKVHIIQFFLSVAMGSEFGSNVSKSKKWKDPMQIYISGNASPDLLEELEDIISEINALCSDGFYIEQVQDSLLSNYHIFVGNPTAYAKMYPTSLEMLFQNNGLFTIHYNDEYVIYKGNMYVNSEDTFLQEQKHLLREELTQSLGLANDVKYYPKSIFYYKRSLTTEYDKLDMEIIRLLYHPGFLSGLSPNASESALRNIMGL